MVVVFLVFSCIKNNNNLTQKQIINQTKLSERTVRTALKQLLSKEIIRETINLLDLREKYYQCKGL